MVARNKGGEELNACFCNASSATWQGDEEICEEQEVTEYQDVVE